MSVRLRHRGPDGEGFWSDAEAGCYLAHRRLAVVDLTKDGAQPMISAFGQFVIIFNGEIYNFERIRAALAEQHRVVGQRSDTAVLLAAIEEWGIDRTLEQLVGMFAFALWDRGSRTLTLVRDRIGKKPLYVCETPLGIGFASELKALRILTGLSDEIDPVSLSGYFAHGYVPAGRSIYQSIRKVAPGEALTFRFDSSGTPKSESRRYWRVLGACDIASQGSIGSLIEYANELQDLICDAIRLRMVADVPLGAFLSGGIDSSTVVALMQSQSQRPVRTFTIGFREENFNEAAHARRVAAHLGTDHTEIMLSGRDALAEVPRLAETFDEPFGDNSAIPMLLVARAARCHVTVALSGDGGDELFFGYNRYFRALQIWRALSRIPKGARSRIVSLLGACPERLWDLLGILLPRRSFAAAGAMRPHQQVRRALAVLRLDGPAEIYHFLLRHWSDEGMPLKGGRSATGDRGPGLGSPDSFCDWMMRTDMTDYLPEDILVKVDRATMAASLEARAPLLDHRVIEASWRIPIGLKVDGGTGKRVLREVLYRFVPREMVDRPKVGFGVPLDSWLRHELREWAESLLSEAALARSGKLAPAIVRTAWERHSTGAENNGPLLWDVLMFQSWFARQS